MQGPRQPLTPKAVPPFRGRMPDSVVLNYAAGGNPQFGGDVILNGLTDDQVLWDYTGTNNVGLNNNASSLPLPLAFMGDILAPNASISLVNANPDGRVWGGDSADMMIVSGDTINGGDADTRAGFAGAARRRACRSWHHPAAQGGLTGAQDSKPPKGGFGLD